MTVPEIVNLVRRLSRLPRDKALKRINKSVPADKRVWAIEGYERLRKAHIWPFIEEKQ